MQEIKREIVDNQVVITYQDGSQKVFDVISPENVSVDADYDKSQIKEHNFEGKND